MMGIFSKRHFGQEVLQVLMLMMDGGLPDKSTNKQIKLQILKLLDIFWQIAKEILPILNMLIQDYMRI